jgi:RNA-directed DNA polymerase
MGVKRQQGSGDQMDLFDQALQASLRLGATGEGGTGSGACAEPQALAAWEQQRALTQHLMEEVAGSANLNQAYKRVKANKGAAGVDAMSIAELLPWIRENREKLIVSLLDGSYQPKTDILLRSPGEAERSPRVRRCRFARAPPDLPARVSG